MCIESYRPSNNVCYRVIDKCLFYNEVHGQFCDKCASGYAFEEDDSDDSRDNWDFFR